MKQKQFTTVLTNEDKIDVKLAWKDNLLWRFSINYRANLGEIWYVVYRVDNYHGYLHEMRYWRSSEQVVIVDKTGWSLQIIFNNYVDEVVENFQKYREYFEEALTESRIERKGKDDENEKKNQKRRTEKKS